MTDPANLQPIDVHRVVVLCYPGFELLDLAGPVNVFTAAHRLGGAYEIRLVAGRTGPIPSAGGVEVLARSSRGLRGPIDTLLVPGATQLNKRARFGMVGPEPLCQTIKI